MANVHNVLFSQATSARTLFGGNSVSDDISTQRNSAGEINSPKVVSPRSLLCGICDEQYVNEEEVTNHMNNDHEDED